jgi:poly-gamma-glutamate capsule biosynthesis protein CapA/YwtB (metallophosphatase superfamily)
VGVTARVRQGDRNEGKRTIRISEGLDAEMHRVRRAGWRITKAWRRTAVAGLTLSLVLAARMGTAACAGGGPSPLPQSFSFAAVGDIIIQQPSARIIRAHAPGVVRRLGAADVSFGNFESNSFELASFAGRPRPPPDGPLLLAPPEVPRELKTLGFGLMSAANNHAGDWGPEGVLATARTLRESGLVSAGTGATLQASRAAACTQVHGTSVALVAVTSSFASPDPATSERAGVNALHLIVRDNGYAVAEADRLALIAAIKEARRSAALVLVSLHTHEPGTDAQHPPQFEVELAHAAIDAGADVFVAHGPHTLRGIEIDKGRPIFYSLGNFAVTQPLPRINPKALVLPAGSIFTRREFFESVLVTGRYEAGRLHELELYPFGLTQGGDSATHGLPEAVSLAQAGTILERLRELSRPFGTQIGVADGVGRVRVAAQ